MLENFEDYVHKIACDFGNVDLGFGADAYGGMGGSVGGSVKLDFTTGQFGLDVYSAVGVGGGVEAGPNITMSSSGSGVISANIITQGGFGSGVGLTFTRNLFGTAAGQTSYTVGKFGTPTGFVNFGVAVGLHTPKMWDSGC
jgi:hypothetical protein